MSDEETEPLWATGPGEILRHGVSLLSEDTDTNRRLALISIDNAVELTMKTFIQLPERITGIKVRRTDRDEFCKTFPSLLDGIEQNAGDRLGGFDLGTIEWFHRLRNQLYHEGNGLTVERRKVEIYAELALKLFQLLFGTTINVPDTSGMKRRSEFIDEYIRTERAFRKIMKDGPNRVKRSGSRTVSYRYKGSDSLGLFEKYGQLSVIWHRFIETDGELSDDALKKLRILRDTAEAVDLGTP